MVPGVAGGYVRPEGLLFFRKPQLLEQSVLEGFVPQREPGSGILDTDVDDPGSSAGREAAGAPGLDLDPGKGLADSPEQRLYAREGGLRCVSEEA